MKTKLLAIALLAIFLVGCQQPVGEEFSSSDGECDISTPWGCMYAPYSEMDKYKMTGRTSGTLNSPSDVLNELETAREHGVSVILTIGSVDECNHMSNNIYQYDEAVNYFDSILTADVKSQLQSYVDDGTLRALRFYDELHYCKCCNTKYTLRYCDRETGNLRTRSDINSVPIGTDSMPGFADLLHHIQFSNGGLPEDLTIGSTALASYMLHVRDRLNVLRAREGKPPLGEKSIMAARGFQGNDDDVDAYTTCLRNNFLTEDELFLMIYPSCQYDPDNYRFFSNYIEICESDVFDFINSWAWSRGAAGDFQSRIRDLEDGGVTKDSSTITLQDLQNACN